MNRGLLQARGLHYNDMNRRQQNRHIKSYETVNAARELAIDLYQSVEPRLNDPQVRDVWIQFTAKMLVFLFPMHRVMHQERIPFEILFVNCKSKATNGP